MEVRGWHRGFCSGFKHGLEAVYHGKERLVFTRDIGIGVQVCHFNHARSSLIFAGKYFNQSFTFLLCDAFKELCI